ncbi:hypothetical protein VIGAN_03025400 [Vigna angularis var. angularis]|uniref:Uncharacterized protein n=1 Tax=Vigna angularis var. angularis TaxID=157739 RepID=A0A0S3RJ51_PHAAN|nr:hypothetical protein VIGAN_03025400 [Vigna angularis var. angularis]
METEEACRKTVTGSLRLTKYWEERRCNSVARHLWWDGRAKDGMSLETPAEEVECGQDRRAACSVLKVAGEVVVSSLVRGE